MAYDHNPGFRRFIEETGSSIYGHPDFKKEDVEARQQLFQRLAERIWTLDRLMLVASEQ
jgi:hypothetical protein